MSDKMWMVRAGRAAYLIDEFEEKNCVAIGWGRLKDLSGVKSKKELAKLYEDAYSEDKKGKRAMAIGQIARFRFEMAKGDYVVTYNPEKRVYLVGKITSDYLHREDYVSDFSNIRKLNWLGKVNRDDISTSTKNTVGAIMTLFLLSKSAKDEFLRLLSGEKPEIVEEEEVEEVDELRKDVMEKGFEFIKDKILKLDWDEMESLVAGILRGMGYKTRKSAKGADRGVDIVASPDGLGLEQPRIRAEVKHREGSIGASDLRSFIGGLRPSDRGLFVSTGGFSKEARYEAERSTIPVSLIDIDELTNLLIENYDNLDNDTKALVPLVKLYWPA